MVYLGYDHVYQRAQAQGKEWAKIEGIAACHLRALGVRCSPRQSSGLLGRLGYLYVR
ncbi:hypothetical protein GGS24DRAFT_45714 [Hypoxylon argillaceum]|nr:hypothetical protein GGS24DRAFT_45714 [Hypoxylon argillaceum]